MINCYFLSLIENVPPTGYWDHGLIHEILDRINAEKREVHSLPESDFAIVVLPAKGHIGYEAHVRKELQKLKSCVLILTSDEESKFDISQIKHSHIKIWVQYPRPDQSESYRKIGCGYPPDIHNLKELSLSKIHDWFFAGQITHSRRELMATQLIRMKNGQFMPTSGFAQGMNQDAYYSMISSSKVVPCPSGPATVDTFRLYESLELGAVPIADTETPLEYWKNYWQWLFDEEPPFPTIRNYDDLAGYTEDCVNQYPRLNNKVQAFWLRYKTMLVKQLFCDIQELTGQNMQHKITVVVPVSPIKSHPSTDIIEETINSIRYHLPDSEIIVTFDGVREEQAHLLDQYHEHIRRFLWKSRFWGNITPIIFDGHIHQNGMMNAIIDQIDTEMILYVEQDTPIVTDEPINWDFLQQAILTGESNVIRFHFEAHIPHVHEYLMLGKSHDWLMRTIQWSQRPHLASKAFYRRMLEKNFSNKARCFIEDLIHGKLIEAYQKDGMQGWNQWRVHIYMPDEKNIKRSYHTDGRAGEAKFDNDQVW